MKRCALILATLMLLLPLVTMTVSANSPPPMPYWGFVLEDVPAGTVYVDLLIRLPVEDPDYVEKNEQNIPESFAPDAGILGYRDGEFCSYTFHFRDAVSDIFLSESGTVSFFDESVSYRYVDDIAARGTVRLALLDREGNILQISRELELRPKGFMEYLVGEFIYNAKEDQVELDTVVSNFGVAFYGVLAAFGMGLTCLLEYLVAIPFGLRRNWGKLILMTNVVSQILMHLSFMLLYRYVFWRYAYATILLEALIFAGEFLFYNWKMKGVSRIRCLLYTVAANVSSLAYGFWLMNNYV